MFHAGACREPAACSDYLWKRPLGADSKQGDDPMKYILMMQFPLGDWKTKSIEAWPPQDVKAHMNFLRRFNKELKRRRRVRSYRRTRRTGADENRARAERRYSGHHRWTVSGIERGSGRVLDHRLSKTPQRAFELAARASAAPGPGGVPLNMPIEVRPVMMSSASGEI
jgi:hypothetical protein